MQGKGPRVITFARILKYDLFPLADIIKTILEIGQQQMNNPVEIEFAVNIDPERKKPICFNLLQIRPIVENNELVKDKIENVSRITSYNVCYTKLLRYSFYCTVSEG